MSEELEWQTRKERIDKKLKSISPEWKIISYKPGLDLSKLSNHAVTEFETDNGPADYALFVKGKLLGIIEAKKVKVGPQNVLLQETQLLADIYGLVAFHHMRWFQFMMNYRSKVMNRGKYWFQPFAVMICLILSDCSNNVLNPEFEPEISNKTDNFQFQVTDISNISQTLRYTWQNGGTMANINQSSSLSSGSATLSINDAEGVEVYRKNLSENGSFITGEGKAGSWTINVNLSKLDGTLNFRAEKRTP